MLSISTQRNLGSSFFNLSIEKFSSFVVRFSMFNCSFSVCPLLSGPFDKTDCPSDSLHTIPFSLHLVNTFFQLFLKIFPSFPPFVNYSARFCVTLLLPHTRCGFCLHFRHEADAVASATDHTKQPENQHTKSLPHLREVARRNAGTERITSHRRQNSEHLTYRSGEVALEGERIDVCPGIFSSFRNDYRVMRTFGESRAPRRFDRY